VIDELQHRGVGRLLLHELIEAARECEITAFVCHVLPGNEPVKALLHDFHGHATPHLEDGLLTYRLTDSIPARKQHGPLPDAAADERDEGAMFRLFRLAAEGLQVIFRRVPGSADEP
jgi:hypothetical protein